MISIFPDRHGFDTPAIRRQYLQTSLAPQTPGLYTVALSNPSTL